jgi:hypothetical protein
MAAPAPAASFVRFFIVLLPSVAEWFRRSGGFRA